MKNSYQISIDGEFVGEEPGEELRAPVQVAGAMLAAVREAFPEELLHLKVKSKTYGLVGELEVGAEVIAFETRGEGGT